MNQFRIIPLSEEVAGKIRLTMKDDYGHALEKVKLASRALCRLCLHDGNPDLQQHILFSYMPFEQNRNPYAEVGPVYIHDRCEQYRNTTVFPPDLTKRKYLTVRGYNADQILVIGDMSEGENIEEMVSRLFENSKVEYVHISDAKSGCYFVRVARG